MPRFAPPGVGAPPGHSPRARRTCLFGTGLGKIISEERAALARQMTRHAEVLCIETSRVYATSCKLRRVCSVLTVSAQLLRAHAHAL